MNRLLNRASVLLGAGVLALAAAPSQAVLVGWNYVNSNDPGGQANILPAEIAGAPGFEQANWNNHFGPAQGPGAVPLALVNDSGAASGVSITNWTQTSNNSWHLNDHASPNAKLLDGFANQQAALTFSGLGAQFGAGYAVVVYYSNNEGPTASTLSITGGSDDTASRAIRTGNTAQSSFSSVGFIQGTNLNSGSVSNYTVFTGLNDASFTVAMTGGGNNGIAGVQIVSNDELPPPPPPGKSIGLNFAGADNNPGGRKVIAPTTSAGAPSYAQINWNNTPGTAQVGTPSSANDTMVNLTDSNGLVTTLDVTFTSAQTWGNNFGGTPTGDQQLNGNGITDGTPTVNVSQVPFSEYDVIVYFGNYDSRNATITLDELPGTVTEEPGSITQRFVTMPNWNTFVAYDQISDAAISAGTRELGNYIVFSGLTGSSFKVTASTGGINGIQIVNTFVAIPEPSTMLLMGVATCGMTFIRRSRRNA